ncbi:hypothetical protein [Cereibacter sphaeroides]|jgi:hypothetical protein|uniref:hypothetical protein n=1 Tax=Cereibacter sphaeroides TaxID=1063 RepID=UPI0011926518|nr:hypothetical protein [Cereibacter sphaeroides]QJC86743.1 hypothetical protein HGN32_21380 [Cereibacter sphaeroides]GEM94661.1 hypothetical protein RSP03_37280 [Cereibacter sphaeroides]
MADLPVSEEADTRYVIAPAKMKHAKVVVLRNNNAVEGDIFGGSETAIATRRFNPVSRQSGAKMLRPTENDPMIS